MDRLEMTEMLVSQKIEEEKSKKNKKQQKIISDEELLRAEADAEMGEIGPKLLEISKIIAGFMSIGIGIPKIFCDTIGIRIRNENDDDLSDSETAKAMKKLLRNGRMTFKNIQFEYSPYATINEAAATIVKPIKGLDDKYVLFVYDEANDTYRLEKIKVDNARSILRAFRVFPEFEKKFNFWADKILEKELGTKQEPGTKQDEG